MTTYKELFGKAVKYLSTDPTDDIEGQIWYNSTTGTFKTELSLPDAWASGGTMATGRYSVGGAGIQTAALAFGGSTGPSVSTNATEEYNGLTWGPGGNMGTGRRYTSGCGTQTAGICIGGFIQSAPNTSTSAVENYNGTSWTAGTSLPIAITDLASCGTQTAALSFGGNGSITTTNEYDGSTWTAGGSMTTGRRYPTGAGTQTAGLAFGGKTVPGASNCFRRIRWISLDSRRKFKYGKRTISWSRFTNSSFSFWWKRVRISYRSNRIL
jgi:hypothetical protein